MTTATAIVTITCPSCGGRVEGVQSTNEDQTVKCSFCGTELHVPRVGEVVHERVVREVVHEVEHEVAPAPVVANDTYGYAGTVRPKGNVVAGLIALGLLLPVFGIFMWVEHHQAQQDIDQFDRQEATQKAVRESCEDSCKAQCAHAGDKETGKWSVGVAMNDSDDGTGLEKQMKDTDIMVCTTDCEMKQDCIGLGHDGPQ